MRLLFRKDPLAARSRVTLDVSRYERHNGAAICGTGPLEITTHPDQWSYAAAFRFRSARVARSGRMLVRVKARVEEGRAGIAFIKEDLKEVLACEDHRCPEDGETTIEMVVDNAPASGWIILRNTAAGGVC